MYCDPSPTAGNDNPQLKRHFMRCWIPPPPNDHAPSPQTSPQLAMRKLAHYDPSPPANFITLNAAPNASELWKSLARAESEIDASVIAQIHAARSSDCSKIDRLPSLGKCLKRNAAFAKTVLAMAKIVGDKLYRVRHASLEAYFNARHSMSRAQVYRLLECASIIRDLTAFKHQHIPLNELVPVPIRQRVAKTIRELAPTPATRQALWATVLSMCNRNADDVNSKHVRDAWDCLLTNNAKWAQIVLREISCTTIPSQHSRNTQDPPLTCHLVDPITLPTPPWTPGYRDASSDTDNMLVRPSESLHKCYESSPNSTISATLEDSSSLFDSSGRGNMDIPSKASCGSVKLPGIQQILAMINSSQVDYSSAGSRSARLPLGSLDIRFDRDRPCMF